MNWLDDIEERVEQDGVLARVVIIATDGPTPRAPGTAMLVWRDGAAGRIGRGEAERRAIELARSMISAFGEASQRPGARWFRSTARFSTGKVLGESSGGAIEVLIEVFGRAECAALASAAGSAPKAGSVGAARFIGRRVRSGETALILEAGSQGLPSDWLVGITELMGQPLARLLQIASPGGDVLVIERLEPPRPPFYVYGTGLVARALVEVLAALPFEVIWVDTGPGHFPASVPVGVVTVVSADVQDTARSVRRGALHAVMTADHDLDLAVCGQILRAGSFHYLGVIGSRLKRERLVRHLEADGFEATAIGRLSCPIGLAQIRSKQPSVIAIAIAAQALASLPPDGGQARSS